jgi:hypothetical protein
MGLVSFTGPVARPRAGGARESDREGEPRRQRLKPHDSVRAASVRPLPPDGARLPALSGQPRSGPIKPGVWHRPSLHARVAIRSAGAESMAVT